MNTLQTALHSWREQKTQYEKSIKLVLADISKPIKCIPSAEYEAKQEELKEYLRYNYIYEEDDNFNQVYVHHIVGNNNMTLMELANQLVQNLGGTIKFWQNKICDVACNSAYPPDLTIWEPNRAFEHYMGLSPEFTHNLRKKRSFAKNYLACLTTLCKLIDKSKPIQEDLAKIDENFKKLKKAEEKYYAFMEEVEDIVASKETSNISLKGKKQAKNTLFMFLKPKQDKVNKLANYNFKVHKEETTPSSKLLKGQEYDQFDTLFKKLKTQSRSQRQSTYSEASVSNYNRNCQEDSVPLSALRSELASFMGSGKLEIQSKRQLQDQNTFIWSKQYFFSYWGFPIKYTAAIDFTQPFKIYQNINYEIDSEDEYDELNAEDVEIDDQFSQNSSVTNTSFVVDDDYVEDESEQKDHIYKLKNQCENQRWAKSGSQITQYEIIPIFFDSPLPLPLEETADNFDESFIQKLEGKGRTQIMSIFALEKKEISKNRIQLLLKNDFKKIKRNKQIVYTRSNKSQISSKHLEQVEAFSDNQTSAEIYEISVTCPVRPSTNDNKHKSRDKREIVSNSKRKNVSNETILQQLQSKEE